MNAINTYRRYIGLGNTADRSKAAYKIARIYEEKFCRYGYAQKEYEGFVKDYPLADYRDEAMMGIGRCAEALNDFSNAIIAYERLVENMPSSPHVNLARDRIQYIKKYNLKNYNSATENLLSLMKGPFKEDDESLMMELARIYEEDLKDFNAAVEILTEVSGKYPESKKRCYIGFKMGILYGNLREKARFEKNISLSEHYADLSIKVFKKALFDYPDDPYSDDIALKILEHQKADLSGYMEFTKSYPGSNHLPEVLYKIGSFFLERVSLTDSIDYLNAVEFFKKIIDNFPKSSFCADASFSMGLSYFKSGRIESSIYFFSEVINKFNRSDLLPASHFYLGEVFRMQSKWENAIKNYRTVTYKFPFSVYSEKSYFMIAECTFNKKEMHEALKQFRNFIISYPASSLKPLALLEAGQCLSFINNQKAALKNYLEIQDEFPGSALIPRAAYYTADIYRMQEKDRVAVT
ncbi:MAG: tetratricopeptide repeat protein, partial [bacterium]